MLQLGSLIKEGIMNVETSEEIRNAQKNFFDEHDQLRTPAVNMILFASCRYWCRIQNMDFWLHIPWKNQSIEEIYMNTLYFSRGNNVGRGVLMFQTGSNDKIAAEVLRAYYISTLEKLVKTFQNMHMCNQSARMLVPVTTYLQSFLFFSHWLVIIVV